MRRQRRICTAIGVAASATLALTGATATSAVAGTSLHTITVSMSNTRISFSSGTTLHAGRYIFRVTSKSGEHALQLVKLTPGYTVKQAGADINDAFSGKLSAIHRVDTKIRWFGGADSTAAHPGAFAETLYAGTYYAIDQNSNAMTKLRVYGTPPAGQGWVNQTSTIVARDGERWGSPASIPHAGWTLFHNSADEPHFIVLQQVKSSTTAAQVRQYLASGAQAQPTWALPAGTNTGVISPNTQMLFHYSLPAGKYVLICWWPDDKTGMPHALMGMWKLITLK